MNRILSHIICLLIFISLSFTADEKMFFYSLDDENIYIQELDLLFENINVDLNEEKQSVYLRINKINNEENNDNSLEWNTRALRLRRNKYSEGFSGGNAKDKFTQKILTHSIDDKNIILEMPLISSLEDYDELILRNIPLKSRGGYYGEYNLELSYYNQSNNKKNFVDDFSNQLNWSKTGIKFIVSKPIIEIEKNYNFNDSQFNLPITFSIKNNGKLIFKANRQYQIKLDDNLFWSNKLDDALIFSDGKSIEPEYYEVDIDDNKLNIVFNRDIKSPIIRFNNFNIMTKDKEVPFSQLELLVDLSPTSKYQSDNVNGRNETGVSFVSKTQKTINVENIDITLGIESEGDFSIINDKKGLLYIPPISIKQYNNSFSLNKNSVLNIIIPDNIKLTWGDISENNKNYKLSKISDKNIRIDLNKDFNLEALVIKNLFFNSSRNTVKPFNLKVEFSSDQFDNYENIYCEDFISKGQVDIDINDQVIFTSEFEPILDEIVINQGKSPPLLPGDKIIIDIKDSNTLFFNLNKEIINDNDLDIDIQDQSISILIKESSENLSSISLKNIHFERAQKSESNISFNVRFIPGRYLDLRTNYKINMPLAKLSVIDIAFNLSNNYDVVRDVYNDNNFHNLPDITITNTSNDYYSVNQVSVNIPEFNYEFIKKRLNVRTTKMNSDDIECYISDNKKEIICDFSDDIPSGEIITMPNIQIDVQLTENEDDLNKFLNLDINVNDKIITTQSINSIGIGSPRLISIDNQSIYSNDEGFQALYQIEVDFQDIPNSFKNINQLLLHIPNKIDLEWGIKSDFANIVTSDNKLYKCRVSIGNSKKDILIDISNIKSKQREKMNIGGLDFINSGSDTDDFPLYLSIDDGENYSAKDDRTKKIINEGNSFDIITKEIQEDLFPVKKGNFLIFILDEKSPYVWDNEGLLDDFKSNGKYSDIYKDGSSIKPDSRMLGIHEVLDNGKKLVFPIINDINIQITGIGQMMDYTQILGLRLPIVRQSNTFYDNDKIVKLRLNTMFGDRLLKSSDRGITDNKVTFKSNQWINPKGTKLRCDIVMGEPDEGFKEPVQRLWYMNPQQLKYLADNCDDILDGQEKMNCLSKGIDNIVKVFREDKDKIYIKQDWLFWYYLAYYKFKWTKSLGANVKFPYNLFGETNVKINRKWDKYISEAEKFGYGPKYYSNFPKPDVEDNAAFLVITNEIIPELENLNYQTVYDKLFDGLYVTKKLVNGKKEEVFSRYLIALISDVYFKDSNKIYKKTLSQYQLKKIKNLYRTKKNENISYNYEQYISQHNNASVKEYFITDPRKKDKYNEIVDRITMDPQKIYTDNIIDEKGSVKIFFKHDNQNEAISKDWRVEITEFNNKGFPVFGYGYYSNTQKINFDNQNFNFKGSDTYDINFDDLKKEENGAMTLGLSIGSILLLLLL